MTQQPASSIAEVLRQAEGRAAAAVVLTRYFADPANRQRHSEWQRRRMADPATRAQFSAYALKGSVAAHGIFYCPLELRRLYRKLQHVLGSEAARAEIRRQLEAAAAERLREGGL
jgi:hypothetical protein